MTATVSNARGQYELPSLAWDLVTLLPKVTTMHAEQNRLADRPEGNDLINDVG